MDFHCTVHCVGLVFGVWCIVLFPLYGWVIVGYARFATTKTSPAVKLTLDLISDYFELLDHSIAGQRGMQLRLIDHLHDALRETASATAAPPTAAPPLPPSTTDTAKAEPPPFSTGILYAWGQGVNVLRWRPNTKSWPAARSGAAKDRAAKAASDGTVLLVNPAPADFDESKARAVMSPYGEIESVESEWVWNGAVNVRRTTIRFKRPNEAAAAWKALNATLLPGTRWTLRIRRLIPAPPPPKSEVQSQPPSDSAAQPAPPIAAPPPAPAAQS